MTILHLVRLVHTSTGRETAQLSPIGHDGPTRAVRSVLSDHHSHRQAPFTFTDELGGSPGRRVAPSAVSSAVVETADILSKRLSHGGIVETVTHRLAGPSPRDGRRESSSFSFTPHPWLTSFDTHLLVEGTMHLTQTTATPAATPTLPDLGPGITLLDADTNTTGAVQTLTLDRILLAGADGESVGYWIGDGRHARTDGLHEVAPSSRALDRLQVARAFTTNQHLQLLRTLGERLAAGPRPVVCTLPGFDTHYRDGELARDDHEVFCRALAELRGLAREHDLTVLVTRSRTDEFTAPLERLADHRLKLLQTQFGPQFRDAESGAQETLVYDCGDGWVQTTLAYWQTVLAEREPLYAPGGPTVEVSA